MNVLSLKSKNFDLFFIALELILFLYKDIIISIFPFLKIIKILPDVLLLVYLFFYFCLREKNFHTDFDIKNNIQYVLLILFGFLSIVSFFWSNHNIFAAIDEMRYYLYPFLLYFVYSKILRQDMIPKLIDLLYYSQIINLVFTAYQFFVLNLHPDFCNGIFGFIEYNNAIQAIYSLALSIIAITFFTEKKWNLKKSLFLLLINCLICALSEIKAYFIVLALVFLIFLVLKLWKDPKNKQIKAIIIMGIFLFLAGIVFLSLVMPENIKFMFNISDYLNYEVYGARGGVGRLNFLPLIAHDYFNDNVFYILFGKGIGTISNEFVYTSGKLFSTLGLFGLLCLIFFFLSFFVVCVRKSDFSIYRITASLFSFCLFISIFLWNCILTSSCFFVFFVLALFEFDCKDIRC